MEIRDIYESILEGEKLNDKNFPELKNYIDKINSIILFSEKLFLETKKYRNKETAYINMLISDVIEKRDQLRLINEELADFNEVPIHLLIQLRNIQKQLGLVTNTYMHLFRENYISKMGVK